MFQPQTKLPKVGTTIFTVMSQLALEHQAVNLGQGFPDFEVPRRLVDALARAMAEGRNQYAPMTGVPALRQAIPHRQAQIGDIQHQHQHYGNADAGADAQQQAYRQPGAGARRQGKLRQRRHGV